MVDIPIVLKTKYSDSGTKAMKADFKSIAAGAAGALGGAFAADKLISFTRDSIQLTIVQREAEAQLAAAIESTGQAAGFTKSELVAMAGGLQKVTNFGDEATIAMQSVLATFTNIKKEDRIFERATISIQDMATRLDTDLKSAALQVGKALQDPEKGITALTRAGVQFSEQQKSQIKTMQAAGDMAGAQAVILSELETQFGGAARAAREADGGITGVANAFGDLQEAYGALLIPQKEHTALLEDAIVGYTVMLTELPKIGNAYAEYQKDLEGVVKWQSIATESAIMLATGGLASGPIADAIAGTLGLAQGNEELAKTYAELNEETIKAAESTSNFNLQVGLSEEQQKALLDTQEKVKAAIEERREIERDAVRELIDIEREANSDRLDAAEEFRDSINDIREKAGKDAIKDEQKLARSLAKVDTNAAKKIKDIQKKAVSDDKKQSEMSRIEKHASEASFQLSLQHMAEDGNAIGIRRAKERRAIEEEERMEAARVQEQIEAASQKEEIERVRETARERKQELKDSAALENELRKEGLATRIDEERDYFMGRQELIEKGKADAIRTVGEEMVGIETMTISHLMALQQKTAMLSRGIGAEFARGVTEGYRAESEVTQVVNNDVSVRVSGTDTGPIAQMFSDGTNKMMRQLVQMQKEQLGQ